MVQGNPILFGTPKANAFCERLVKTVRTELLNHYIFWNENHLRRAFREYLHYFNAARCHQGIKGIPESDPQIAVSRGTGGNVVPLRVLGGLITYNRREMP